MSHPKGYVQLGTLSHKILRLCWEQGTVTQPSLAEDLGGNLWISKTLKSLLRRKLLFKVGSQRGTSFRSHAVFALRPRLSSQTRVLSNAEKAKRHRERGKMKVASVFDFRGRIEL